MILVNEYMIFALWPGKKKDGFEKSIILCNRSQSTGAQVNQHRGRDRLLRKFQAKHRE